MANIIFYHGTPAAFDSLNVPSPGDTASTRHGMDQYGIGFYAATSPDSSIARSYAETYAGLNGAVLRGSLDSSALSFITYDQHYDATNAKALVDALRSTPASTPQLTEHLDRVADLIESGTTGKRMWETLTSPSALLGDNAPHLQNSLNAIGYELDSIATDIINRAGFDGLHIPAEDTLVFKGDGYAHLPDLYVDGIVGAGPRNAADYPAFSDPDTPLITKGNAGRTPVSTVDQATASLNNRLSTPFDDPARGLAQQAMQNQLSFTRGNQSGARLVLDGWSDDDITQLQTALRERDITFTYNPEYGGDDVTQTTRVINLTEPNLSKLTQWAGDVPSAATAALIPETPTSSLANIDDATPSGFKGVAKLIPGALDNLVIAAAVGTGTLLVTGSMSEAQAAAYDVTIGGYVEAGQQVAEGDYGAAANTLANEFIPVGLVGEALSNAFSNQAVAAVNDQHFDAVYDALPSRSIYPPHHPVSQLAAAKATLEQADIAFQETFATSMPRGNAQFTLEQAENNYVTLWNEYAATPEQAATLLADVERSNHVVAVLPPDLTTGLKHTNASPADEANGGASLSVPPDKSPSISV